MFAKKNWKKGVMVAGTFACMAAFSLFGKMDVNAATAATDLKQTDDNTNSVRIEWNGALDDSEYYVEISEDQQNWVEKDSGSASFKHSYLNGLNANKFYILLLHKLNFHMTYNFLLHMLKFYMNYKTQHHTRLFYMFFYHSEHAIVH